MMKNIYTRSGYINIESDSNASSEMLRLWQVQHQVKASRTKRQDSIGMWMCN